MELNCQEFELSSDDSREYISLEVDPESIESEEIKDNTVEIDPISNLDKNKFPNLNNQYNEDGLIGPFKRTI